MWIKTNSCCKNNVKHHERVGDNRLLATNLEKQKPKAKSDYPNKAVAQDYSPPSPGKYR